MRFGQNVCLGGFLLDPVDRWADRAKGAGESTGKFQEVIVASIFDWARSTDEKLRRIWHC